MKKSILNKIAFFTITCCVIPVVFFLILEGILRISNYGYDGNFFVKEKINGKDCYVNNSKFSWRFFPKGMARFSAPIVVPVIKEKGVLRVFVLGESAAMGDPDPAFSFSRVLRAMLEKKYPQCKIEIYNTGVTAINSNVILPIFYDCLKLEPDAFIVYMGNNEVIGPYGVSSLSNPFNSSRQFIKAQVKIGNTRIGQWIKNLTTDEDIDFEKWRGMESYLQNQLRFGSKNLEIIYDHFYENIKEICKVASNNHVKVILSTVITNDLDGAPFASLHREDFNIVDLKKWNEYYKEGISRQSIQSFEDALINFEKAYQIDAEHAELNFRMGQCFLALKNSKKAKLYLSRARDFDVLRFRTDSKMNELVINMAEKNKKILLVDSKKIADENSPDSISGNNILYEHVHLNLEGNYLLANSILPVLEESLNLSQSDISISKEYVKKRLVYSSYEDNRINKTNLGRIQAPPFTNQYTNATLKKDLTDKIENVVYQKDFAITHRASFDSILSLHPDDYILRVIYLDFLNNFKFYPAANQQAEIIFKQLPHEYMSYIYIAGARKNLGMYTEADGFLKQAIDKNPYISIGYQNMINLLVMQGYYDKIDSYIKKSNISKSVSSSIFTSIGNKLADQQRFDSATHYFNKAILLDSNNKIAKKNLNTVTEYLNRPNVPSDTVNAANLEMADKLFIAQRFAEAIPYYKKVIQSDPNYAEAYNNIGISYIQLYQFHESIPYLQQAIVKSPLLYDPYINLAKILIMEQRYKESTEILQKAEKIKKDKELYQLFADAYRGVGDSNAMIEYQKRADASLQ